MRDFAVCFEAHRPDGLVWAIKSPIGNIDDDADWILAAGVTIEQPIETAYRGKDSADPKAYFRGICRDVLTFSDHHAVIV